MKKEWFNKNRNIITAVLCGIGLCLFCIGIVLLFPSNKRLNNNRIKEYNLGDESHCVERNPDNSCKTCDRYFELENGECVLSCDSDHEPNATGDACVCKSGYENISWECVTCNGDNEYHTINDKGVKECWTCDATGAAVNNDHTACVCGNGGYINESNQCVMCTGTNEYHSGNDCHTCNATGEIANADHTDCICESGKYYDENYQCVTCDGANQYHVANYCFTCPSGSTPNDDHTTCICENGKYFDYNNDQCLTCDESNQYHSNNRCYTCPNNSVPNDDHTDCICSNGKYFDYNNDQCVTCNGTKEYHSGNDCHTCNATGEIANADHTDCICENGGYLSVDGSQCVATCDGANQYKDEFASGKKTCNACPSNSTSNEDHTDCICDSGKYFDYYNDQCVTCNGTKEYHSGNRCKTAPDGTIANEDHTDFVCENSGYLWDHDNEECVATCNGANQIVYTTLDTGVQRCMACPSGEVANDSHTECVSASSPTSSPSPTSVATPSPTSVATPSPTPVVTPSPTPVVTPSPTPVVTPSPTPIVTPSPTTSPEITPEATTEPITTPATTTIPEEPESTTEPIETPTEPYQVEVESGACYKDSAGYYYWGNYEDDPDYVLEPTITNRDMCKYEISSVPRTDANVSKLVYAFMIVLMGFGIGFICYSAKLKKSK